MSKDPRCPIIDASTLYLKKDIIYWQTFVRKFNLVKIHSFEFVNGPIIDAMQNFWNFCHLKSAFWQPVEFSMNSDVVALERGKDILGCFTEV